MKLKLHSCLFIFSLLFLFGCETVTTIVNNLPERDANEILVLLASRGVPAEKRMVAVTGAGGATSQGPMWDITVPAAQITQALAILNQEGLPRVRGTNLLDLFGNPGIVPSDLQDRIRYQEGLAQQLAATIRKMEGVMDANVQVTVPREEESGAHLTASVYVKHRGVLDSSNNLLITKIKRYVANSIPGLSTDNVSVISDKATSANLSLTPFQEVKEDSRHYVSIWSIAIARESVTRFRLIFYLFIFLLFLLASLVAFLLWKFYPLLKEMPSWQEVFSLQQITTTYFVDREAEVIVENEEPRNL